MVTFTDKREGGRGDDGNGEEREQWLELTWSPVAPAGMTAEQRGVLDGAYDYAQVDLSPWIWAVEGFSPEVEVDWMDGSERERYVLQPRGGELSLARRAGLITHRYDVGSNAWLRARIYGAFGFGPGDVESNEGVGIDADGWREGSLEKLASFPALAHMMLRLYEVRMSEGEDILLVGGGGFGDEAGGDDDDEFTHRFYVYARGAGFYRQDLRPWLAVASEAEGLYIDWGDGSPVEHCGYAELMARGGVHEHEYAEAGRYTVRVDTVGVSTHEQVVGEAYPRNNGYPLKQVDMAFYGCVQLRRVPGGLLHDAVNNSKSAFAWMFAGCANLGPVPAELLANFSACRVLGAIFGKSCITSVPEGLLDRCVNVEWVDCLFDECKLLESVPEGLFAKMARVEKMSSVFRGCSRLTAVPEGLFRYNTRVREFVECFYGAGLTAVPEGLFRYNTQAVSFSNVFCECSRLTAVPEGLFRYNTRAEDFTAAFQMTALETVPEGLFRYNTQARVFNYCFSMITRLRRTRVTFAHCSKAESFVGTFGSCTNMMSYGFYMEVFASDDTQVDSDGHEHFPASAKDFSRCFRNCSRLLRVQRLWSYLPDAVHENCFVGCVNAENYGAARAAGWAG